MMGKTRRSLFTTITYLVLTGYALISFYPFLWMVSSALKSNSEVLTSNSLFPQEIRPDIIIDTWNKLNFWRFFVNSTIVSLAAVAGTILVYSMAGYGFAKTSFWGRNLFFVGFLGLLLVPGVTVLVPLVQLLKVLGLIGRDATKAATYLGLVVPMMNGAGPFAIFLFRNYFASLPHELHDAARMDGCSEWGIYFRIFLPLSTPVIATVGILNFISSWNAFIWPSIVLNNPDWFTLPLKLKDLDLQIVIQWNVRMAGSLIMVIPAIAVFLFLQRYYIRGLTAGAIKG
ncbi:MAG: carbohydrate ABC transporter permease [Chloroflexi bacterium]|nr:carbohydrate ABC transporter permease [Chloroflexota bacterium]